MLCSKCGQNLDNSNKFCMNCGNRVYSDISYNNNLYQKPQVNNFSQAPNNLQNNIYNQPMYNNQGSNYVGQNRGLTPTQPSHQQMYNQPMMNQQMYNQPMMNHPVMNRPMNNFNNNPFNQPNFVKKKNNNLMYTCLGIISITLIIVVTLIIVYNEDSVYFSKEKNDDYISYEDGKAPQQGKTVIEPERIYYMTINNEQEAYNKIREDSVSQKNTCSKEIVEIENRIVTNYNITAVNLCEMDIGYAKEVEQVIKQIYEEYPTARGYLTNFTLINAPASEGYIAAFRAFYYFVMPTNGTYPIVSKNSILLNTEYFLDSNYMINSVNMASKRGHFPPNATRSSPVAHEFGHYLSFISAMKKYNINSVLMLKASNFNLIYDLALDWQNGKHSLDIINAAYKNYQKKYNDYSTSLLEFRSSISAYAVAKDSSGKYIYDETIAEAFHDYYLNGNSAKPASKEIIAELKRRLK